MASVRLPVDIEQKLNIFAQKRNKSKTDIIKEALEFFFEEAESKKDSYELGKDYFGKFGSGEKDLSVTYKTRLKGKINAKYHTR